MAGTKTSHVGRLGFLAFNLTGTHTTPVWAVGKRIGDVDIDEGSATSDRDTRESGNTKTIVGNNKFSIKFTHDKKKGQDDPILRALQQSKREKLALDVLALDEAITVTGASGIRGPFIVTVLNKKEPVNDQQTYEVELHETYDYDDDDEIIDVDFVKVDGTGLVADSFAA